MKLYLDTSTDTAIVRLDDREYRYAAGRQMAEGLLAFIRDRLVENSVDFSDITSIEYYSGPGSFTGLRIGAAVVNTLAHELGIPLYTHTSQQAPLIIPDYGRPARITSPRK